MTSKETDFSQRLGNSMEVWASHHQTPDNSCIEFIGPEGRKSFSPRQLAREIIDQTTFGQERTRFYLDVSANLGDESGERIIHDFLNWEEK